MKRYFQLNKVLFKYFSYYLFLFIFVLSGIFYILHVDIKSKITDLYTKDSQTSLDYLSKLLDTEFFNLYQIDRTLSKTPNFIYLPTRSEAFDTYLVNEELSKFTAFSNLVSDIVYIDRDNNNIYGNLYHYDYQNSMLSITISVDNSYTVSLDSINPTYNSFIRVETNSKPLVFFIPEQNSTKYMSLFLVDTTELNNLLHTVALSTTSHFHLLDQNGQLILGNMNDIPSSTYTSSTCTYTGLTLINYFDESLYNIYVDTIFRNTLKIVFIISILLFLLIIVLTHYTYAPLKLFAHMLHEAHIDPSVLEESYLDLEYTGKMIQSIKEENNDLLDKIEHYRISIQKSLLSSNMPLSESNHLNLDNLDMLFQSDTNVNIAVIRFAISETIDSEAFFNTLTGSFDSKTTVIALNISTRGLTYLIGMPINENYGDLLSSHEFSNICRQYHCSYQMSRISNNPIEIPRLFESVMLSSHRETENRESVYELLDDFVTLLNSNSYVDAVETLRKLLQVLNEFSYLDFFIQSVLIDALTAIVSMFSKYNIPFNLYNDIYYNALFLCRSTNYSKEYERITHVFLTLISTLEKKQLTFALTKNSFIQYMEQEFTNSTLSTMQVGDYFQESGAYISYWVKKNFDQTFSEYLWSLRFAYAIELMKDPEIRITDISEKVGYDNYSSFRRKFKSHCGIAPSEYREKRL